LSHKKTPRPTKTRRRVKVLDIVKGHSPTVVLFERLKMKNARRTFTQHVKVLDQTIYRRLLDEVEAGDEIEAVVVTEFGDHDYTTYLADFSK